MFGKTETVINHENAEMVMTRYFDAPRDLVFQMYTDAEHLSQWWGPIGWTTTTTTFNPTSGGMWHYCMRSEEGQESWGKSLYLEVVPPERIVYRDYFSDAAGGTAEGMPEMLITNEFFDEAGKTKFVSRTKFATLAELESIINMGAEAGINETWDRLDTLLAKLQSH